MSTTEQDRVISSFEIGGVPSQLNQIAATPGRHSARWCFLLGLGGLTFVHMIGYIAFTEIYLLATAIWRFGRYMRLITTGVAARFFLLWLGWLAAALASDLTNRVTFELLARGVSRALFTGIATLSIFIIIFPSLKRMEWILLGLPFSMTIGLFYFRSGQSEIYGTTYEALTRFDSSINYIITAFVVAAAAWMYERRPVIIIMVLLALGPIYVLFGSRSAGVVMVLAGLTTLVFYVSQSRRRPRLAMGVLRLIGLGVVVIVGLAALKTGYEYAAENRMLGDAYVRKYEREKQAKGGVFVGSRGVYILTGLLAWQDKPILGHGSWPADEVGYYRRAADIVGYPVKVAPVFLGGRRVRNLLPVHSQLFGALVEHGIFAFAFFAYVAWLVFWSITFVPMVLPRWTAVFSIFYWSTLWHLIASPQGNRIPTAVAWAFFLLAYAYRSGRKSSTARMPEHSVNSLLHA